MSENNSLVKVENSFFKKIINWFKGLFKKDKVEVNDSSVITNESIDRTLNSASQLSKFSEQSNNISNNKQEEKKKFFEKYNALKLGEIDFDEVSYDELKQFNIMIEEENRLKYEELLSLREESKMLLLDIKKQMAEKKKLKKMIVEQQNK